MISKTVRTAFLFDNWESIAADAYEGFIENGRGCLVIIIDGIIDLDDPDKVGAVLKTSYIPQGALFQISHEIPNIYKFLADYDPLTQIALIWMDNEGNYELTIVGVMDFVKEKFETLRDIYENRQRAGGSPAPYSNPPFETVDIRPGFTKMVYKN